MLIIRLIANKFFYIWLLTYCKPPTSFIGGKMINQPTTYAPVQQTPVMPQAPQFNAIKIDIQGASVGTSAPAAPVAPLPPVAPPENAGQNVNYTA